RDDTSPPRRSPPAVTSGYHRPGSRPPGPRRLISGAGSDVLPHDPKAAAAAPARTPTGRAAHRSAAAGTPPTAALPRRLLHGPELRGSRTGGLPAPLESLRAPAVGSSGGFGATPLLHYAELSESARAGRRSTATPCRVKNVVQMDADTNSHSSWSNSLRASSSWRLCWCMPPIKRARSFGP